MLPSPHRLPNRWAVELKAAIALNPDASSDLLATWLRQHIEGLSLAGMLQGYGRKATWLPRIEIVRVAEVLILPVAISHSKAMRYFTFDHDDIAFASSPKTSVRMD